MSASGSTHRSGGSPPLSPPPAVVVPVVVPVPVRPVPVAKPRNQSGRAAGKMTKAAEAKANLAKLRADHATAFADASERRLQ